MTAGARAVCWVSQCRSDLTEAMKVAMQEAALCEARPDESSDRPITPVPLVILDEMGYYMPPMRRIRHRSPSDIRKRWAARQEARQLREELESTSASPNPVKPRL